MKRIIEYVPIITVCLIYFGFCNLHYYYKEFNIDIYNYVSNSEILLSFLPSIVLLASTIYIFTYNKIINHSVNVVLTEKHENIVEEEKGEIKLTTKEKLWNLFTSLPFQILLLLGLDALVRIILMQCLDFKSYELQFLHLINAIIFFTLIYFSSDLFKNQEVINENLLLITIFSVAYIGIQIGNYRRLDADKIKNGISKKEITFQYNNKTVKTSKQNVYVGQTQTNLFVYDTKNKNTIIYKIENIDSLVIK